MKTKRTIAVITAARTGVSLHRQIIPHSHLQGMYPDEFEILIKDGVQEITETEWERINLIHFSGIFDWQKEDYFRRKNIVTVLDKDDYWDLPVNHIRKYEWEMRQMWYKTELSIAAADHIICTTDYLYDKIAELNQNITVIPNSINPRMKMYEQREWNINAELIRFGGLWGLTHLEDIEMMRQSFIKVDEQRDLRGRYQFILGGFAMGETERNIIYVKDGKQNKIKLPPYETIWGKMERAMTNDYSMLRGQNEYLKYLAQYSEVETEKMEEKVYKRIWGRDLFEYCEGYNEMDVVLAPLADNEFNRCKSQLKMIEAGYFGRPVICSEVIPYLIDGVNEENCFMVSPSRPIDFYICMRKLIKEPQSIIDMGAKLKEIVTQKYMMDEVNKTRRDLYNYLIDKN
jgi:glycosyltransferase involved in cell wall biosynthesis